MSSAAIIVASRADKSASMLNSDDLLRGISPAACEIIKVNQGSALKTKRVTTLHSAYPPSRPGPDTICNIFTLTSRVDAVSSTVSIDVMERHPYTTQTFVPLGANGSRDEYVVVIAGDCDGYPDMQNAIAVTCHGAQAVTYAPGQWHAPMIAIDGCLRFAVFNAENSTEDDCEEVVIPTIHIQLATSPGSTLRQGFIAIESAYIENISALRTNPVAVRGSQASVEGLTAERFMAAKLILCVFIHGFKGGTDTFEIFPAHIEHLCNAHSDSPKHEFRSIVYPPYETQGDFRLAVSKLREWLQNKVIDLETKRGTHSPMLNSSVKVILLGHSMGGIVASDAVLGIYDEFHPSPLFPSVIGVICLDTPILGLAPSLWTNQAEDLFTKGKNIHGTAAGIMTLGSGLFASKALQVKEQQREKKESTSNSAIGWKSIAALSAVGAAALGTAAYTQKDKISQGLTWVSDHLSFIGILRRPEELSQRTVRINSIEQVDFSLFYTIVGTKQVQAGQSRVFIVLPKGKLLLSRFHEQVNDLAKDEIAAHTTMFSETRNSGYHALVKGVCEQIGTTCSKSILTLEEGEFIS